MATYLELLNKALTITETTGVTDVIAVAKEALERAMRYVSRRVDIPALIQSASYVWGPSTTTVAVGVGGFGITNMQTPYMLLGNDVPYRYVEFKEWLVLQNVPGYARVGIDYVTTDERTQYQWTINLSNEVELYPNLSDTSTAVLYYLKAPEVYADGTTPELPSTWQDILVDAACIVIKTYIENPSQVINFEKLFSALDEMIDMYKTEREGRFKRTRIKISSHYPVRRQRWGVW